jgi:hypothetical protein
MRKATTFLPALALGIAGVTSGAASSFAGPITYTEQAVATGTLNGASFTMATVTLTMMNDTTNIIGLGSGLFEINGTATVSVAGGTPISFAHVMQVFSAQQAVLGPTVGFFDTQANSPFGLDVLDDTNSAFATYALGPVGPIVGTAALGNPVGFLFPLAGGGSFSLSGVGTGVGDATATFTAIVTAVPAPPIGRGLPVALALLFGALLQRRRRRAPLN